MSRSDYVFHFYFTVDSKTIKWSLSREKRSWRHCLRTLKRLGVLPKVLYFIGFVHLNPNFGYQVIKEARFKKIYICTSHPETLYLHETFLWNPQVISQSSKIVSKKEIESGAGLGPPEWETEAPSVSGCCSDRLQGSYWEDTCALQII